MLLLVLYKRGTFVTVASVVTPPVTFLCHASCRFPTMSPQGWHCFESSCLLLVGYFRGITSPRPVTGCGPAIVEC